jgi:TPR repeat protein
MSAASLEREIDMARFEMPSAEMAQMAGSTPSAESYLELGLQHSTGRTGGIDLIEAHKWFNIAAAKGCREAIRMRCEVAGEMSAVEIAEAQRAARAFLALH